MGGGIPAEQKAGCLMSPLSYLLPYEQQVSALDQTVTTMKPDQSLRE